MIGDINHSVFVGLSQPASVPGCVNANCSNLPSLTWEASGTPFVFETWLTGGINVKPYSNKECTTFRNGIIICSLQFQALSLILTTNRKRKYFEKYLAFSQASWAVITIFFVKEMKNKQKKAKIFTYIFPLR